MVDLRPLARRTRRLALAASLTLVAVACTSTPAPSAPSRSAAPSVIPSATTTAMTPSASPSEASATTVRLESPPRGSFLVLGDYPPVDSSCAQAEQPRLHARYPGTLEVERSDDGTLALTVTVPFDTYLDGIAEMPPSWPMAALEAQAVAARSYALATTGWDGEEGEPLPDPICATTSCQVYGGMPLQPSSDARRWYRAVRATDGEVILFDGRPAETVYFSTSNGHTYGNEDVFGSAPLPYLRPVVEHDDGASPLSHWRVRLRSADLARFLAAAGEWPQGRPIRWAVLDGVGVTVTGGGTSRSMDLGTFRDAVNAWAHCLEPGRYPSGGMPTTIPSRWLSISSGPDAVTVRGRGWGHGVGMVQWGAYGKARRGLSADQILAFYYGGFRPKPFPEPGLIHIEVASGLTSLRVRPSGPGGRLNGEALDPGRTLIDGGEALTVRTP
jgi:SpoIID/LytB domain protein